MKSLHLLPLALAAACASTAMGAGTLVLRLVPRNSTLFMGHTMEIDVFVDYSGVIGGLSMAGFKFDVVGDSNGLLAGDVNDAVFSNGDLNGTPSGPNLLDFAGGQLPLNLGGGNTTNYLGTLSYTDVAVWDTFPSYIVTLGVVDYVAPTGALNVYTSASGAQSRSSISGITGMNHIVIIESTPFEVVVPAPAACAPFGLAILAFRRRR